jgi:NADPH:quinone reductase-like Zn-dependent oxidoreductase
MSTTATIADLAGKTALVTGATSGIGKAAALVLAEHGATVLVHGRDAARGVGVVEQIELTGGHARFVAANLSDPDDVAQLAAQVGPVDILVNNAGSSWFGPSSELTVAIYDRLFRRQRALRLPAHRRPRAGDGPKWWRQRHQRRQHGRQHRPVRWRRLQRDQSRPRGHDPLVGR